MQAFVGKPYRKMRGARPEGRGVDWLFVSAVALLTLLGLVMIYSTTFFWSAADNDGNPLAIFSRQVMWAGLGGLAFLLMARLDYGRLQPFVPIIMLGSLVVLVGVLLFGDNVFGARRTLFGGSVQPSEIVKMGVILYAAAWLSSRRDQVQSMVYGLVPFGVIVGLVSFLVVIQPDLSTAATILIAAGVMFFMAGASLIQVTVVTLTAVGAFTVLFTLFPHASSRISQFVTTWQTDDVWGMEYHIRQSLLAVSEGGWFGTGIGASNQKFGLLPTPHTDSVFAVLANEMGWVGVALTLGLFMLLMVRGLRIAHRADSFFGAYIAVGVVTWITAQMLLNVLSTVALIPFSGVPVPFLSLGGSSMVSLLAACGILISIARGSRVLQEEGEGRTTQLENETGNHGRARTASVNLRGRNSRTRVARAYRTATAHEAHADEQIVGRDAINGYTASQQRSARNTRMFNERRAGPVRWRRNRNGTRPRLPRERDVRDDSVGGD